RATGLYLHEGKAESLPFADGSFDLVSFENSLHHVSDVGQALREAARIARRAIVILDPWFDLSIPSQALGDRFERWLRRIDRMTGMAHRDPISAGEIMAASDGHVTGVVAIRHLLHLTPLSPETFQHLAGRAQPHMGDPTFAAPYKSGGM